MKLRTKKEYTTKKRFCRRCDEIFVVGYEVRVCKKCQEKAMGKKALKIRAALNKNKEFNELLRLKRKQIKQIDKVKALKGRLDFL